MPAAIERLDGQVFGALTVTGRAAHFSRKHAFWACRCVCGRDTVVRADKLKQGKTRSCGRGCHKRNGVTDGQEPHVA